MRLMVHMVMVKKHFQSSVNIAKTRSFPGVYIASDHDMVMITFKLKVKKTKKQSFSRLKFDLQ